MSRVCFPVYIYCTFREFVSRYLLYFENGHQATTILYLLYSTQNPGYDYFVPEHELLNTDLNKNTVRDCLIRKPKHRCSQISGHFSGIFTQPSTLPSALCLPPLPKIQTTEHTTLHYHYQTIIMQQTQQYYQYNYYTRDSMHM
jgi:hypothetical protein